MSRIILVGPTAGGKTYLSEKLQKSGYKLEISYTSRSRRKEEINGVDYKFLSKEEFEKKIKEKRFYEWVKYNENYYGTGLDEFYNSDIFVWETDGIEHLKPEDRKTTTVIYIDTPISIRIKRMEERKWEDKEILKRVKTDVIKFLNFNNYDIKIESNG